MASRHLRKLGSDKPLGAVPFEEVDEADDVRPKHSQASAFALLGANAEEDLSSTGGADVAIKKKKKKNKAAAAASSSPASNCDIVTLDLSATETLVPAAAAPTAASKPAALKAETKQSSANKKAAAVRKKQRANDDDEDIDALVAAIDGKIPAAAGQVNLPHAAASVPVPGIRTSPKLRCRCYTQGCCSRRRQEVLVRESRGWLASCSRHRHGDRYFRGGNQRLAFYLEFYEVLILGSTAYQSLQETYEGMVATNDSQHLIDFARHQPFHVDTSLQLSELAKATGDYENSAKLITRCIYAYETAIPSQFDPATGTNRINFGENANRGFFLALFRQLQIAGRQSCNFTAYNIAKFLLGLDPSDPLFIVLIVDYYALRCRDFTFVFRLTKEFVTPAAVLSLPNLNFSLALARFHQEKEDKDSKVRDLLLVIKRGPASCDLLVDALMRFPIVLLPLLKKIALAISPTTPDGKKVDLTAHSFFLDAHTSPSLQHLVSLYVERSYGLWKAPDTLKWLEQAVTALLALLEKKDPRLAAATAAVKAAYTDESNRYHKLEMDQYTEQVATVIPANLLAAHDDLPQVRPPPRVRATTNNPLALFFSSLMPWNPVPNAPAAGGDARWLADALASVGIGEAELRAAMAQGEAGDGIDEGADEEEEQWEEHPHQQ